MYLMWWLKYLNINPDFAIRAKLVWINHQHKYQKPKFVEVCSCLYEIDEETLIRLIWKQIIRDQLIDIYIRKLLVKLDNKNIYTVKSDRKDKLYFYHKRLSYSSNLIEELEIG